MATPKPDATDRTESTTAATPVEDLSYEQAREELVAVVTRLETGGETLEESLALWERGEALAARCQAWLDGARARLDAAQQATGDTTGSPDAAVSADAAGSADVTDEEDD